MNTAISEKARMVNVQRIYWTAPIMTLTLFGVGAFHALTLEAASPVLVDWRRQTMVVNALGGIGSLVGWVIAAKLRKRPASDRSLVVFQYAVVGALLLFGIVKAVIDQRMLISVTPILLVSTIVGTFYYLRPSRAVVVFFSFGLIYYFSLIHLSELPLSALSVSLSNGILAVSLGFSLSLINWRNFRLTEQQREQIESQQAILEKMAYQDPLTGLPNRRFLDLVVQAELKRMGRNGRQSCLIMFDIDDFKRVNDTYGHPVGDGVLCEMAKLLQKSMRGSDILVRLGGEEFILLVPDTPLSEAVSLADRLRSQVGDHVFNVEGCQVQITASFGVAPLETVEETKNYLSSVDKALYLAKGEGKNRIAFWQESTLESPGEREAGAAVDV